MERDQSQKLYTDLLQTQTQQLATVLTQSAQVANVTCRLCLQKAVSRKTLMNTAWLDARADVERSGLWQ